jgi:hypothetical protein
MVNWNLWTGIALVVFFVACFFIVNHFLMSDKSMNDLCLSQGWNNGSKSVDNGLGGTCIKCVNLSNSSSGTGKDISLSGCLWAES